MVCMQSCKEWGSHGSVATQSMHRVCRIRQNYERCAVRTSVCQMVHEVNNHLFRQFEAHITVSSLSQHAQHIHKTGQAKRTMGLLGTDCATVTLRVTRHLSYPCPYLSLSYSYHCKM